MKPEKVIIVGASSGIGLALAKTYITAGCRVGACARREDRLQDLANHAAEGQVVTKRIDITDPNADTRLYELMDSLGGCDLYIHVSGIGFLAEELDPQKELETLQTNVVGFARSVLAGFIYMSAHGGGRLAAVTSVAGTRGIGSIPAYSAGKSFSQRYLQALQQKSYTDRLGIRITDIRPGFVDTALLRDAHRFPMVMQLEPVARDAAKAIDRCRRVAVIDWRYRLLCAIWRALPRRIYERMTLRTIKRE